MSGLSWLLQVGTYRWDDRMAWPKCDSANLMFWCPAIMVCLVHSTFSLFAKACWVLLAPALSCRRVRRCLAVGAGFAFASISTVLECIHSCYASALGWVEHVAPNFRRRFDAFCTSRCALSRHMAGACLILETHELDLSRMTVSFPTSNLRPLDSRQ
jgi:hypothetical protein